jgi:hypothetical protein
MSEWFTGFQSNIHLINAPKVKERTKKVVSELKDENFQASKIDWETF